jgi:hypothetical protein
MRACKLFIAAWVLAALAGAGSPAATPAADRPVYDLVQALQDQGWPPEAASRLVALAYDAGLDRAAAADLLAAMHALQVSGFPAAPLAAKIDEGLAKRIPAARIVAALQTRVDHGRFVMQLPQASTAGKTPAEVESLAMLTDSLELGLAREDLQQMAQSGSSLAMLAVAAEMTAMLQQIGFDPESQARIAHTGLKRGTLGKAWRSLPQVVALARQRDIPDAEIAQAVLERLEMGAGPQDLLPALGFTGRDLRQGPMAP